MLKEVTRLNNMINEFYEEYTKLEPQHPDEFKELVRFVHGIQYLIGMRQLRYDHPDVYPVKNHKY